MDTDRKTAILVGVLYIIGTAAGVASMVVAAGHLHAPNYLDSVAANQNQVMIGAIFLLIMGFALAMVAACMFPILRRYNEILAIGYVIFRGALETAMYIAAALIWLLVVVVARQHADSGADAAAAELSSLGLLLTDAGGSIVAINDIVFSTGGLMLYYLLYRTRLIPRWLSIWGILGLIAYLTAGVIDIFSTEVVYLLLPLAVQEMVMAVWLIVKGFNSSASPPVPAAS